jgi:tetratricopeptide (TPR) repeat protein
MPTRSEAFMRHAAHYLSLAERAAANLTGPEQTAWLERLEAAHDNLRVALAWGEANEPVSLLRLAVALGRFWDERGYFSEGRAWLAKALRRGSDVAPDLRAKALFGIGMLTKDDVRSARAHGRQSLALFRRLGDERGMAGALELLGNVAHQRGKYRSARVLYERGLALRREAGDRQGIASSLHSLGMVALGMADYAGARSFFAESLSLFEGVGDTWGIAWSLSWLGSVAHFEGDMAAAAAFYKKSLALFRELANPRHLAAILDNLGAIAYSLADYTAAHDYHTESFALAQGIGDTYLAGSSLQGLGDVAQARGDYAGASACYRDSLKRFQQVDERRRTAECLEELALIAEVHGKWERMTRLLGAAEALRESVHAPIRFPSRSVLTGRRGADVRAALGEEFFAAAWAEGHKMSPEQAVLYALDGDDT